MTKQEESPQKKPKRLTYSKIMTELRGLRVATRELQSINGKLKSIETDSAAFLELMLSHAKKIDTFNKRIDNMEEVLLMIHTNVRRSKFLHDEIYG